LTRFEHFYLLDWVLGPQQTSQWLGTGSWGYYPSDSLYQVAYLTLEVLESQVSELGVILRLR